MTTDLWFPKRSVRCEGWSKGKEEERGREAGVMGTWMRRMRDESGQLSVSISMLWLSSFSSPAETRSKEEEEGGDGKED